jgi:hypothetical protein
MSFIMWCFNCPALARSGSRLRWHQSLPPLTRDDGTLPANSVPRNDQRNDVRLARADGTVVSNMSDDAAPRSGPAQSTRRRTHGPPGPPQPPHRSQAAAASNSVTRHAFGQANTSVQDVRIGRIEW